MYITEEKRDRLNPLVDALLNELARMQLDDEDFSDDITANIEYVVLRLLTTTHSKDEAAVREALGSLSNVKLEFYRRVAAPQNVQSAFDRGDTFDINLSAEDAIRAGLTE